MLLWKRYGNNKMAAILHLQQYSRRLNFFFPEMTGVVTLSRFRCTGVGVRSLCGKGEAIRCLGVARLLAAGSDARGRATGWFPFSCVHA